MSRDAVAKGGLQLPWVASLPPECWSAVGDQVRDFFHISKFLPGFSGLRKAHPSHKPLSIYWVFPRVGFQVSSRLLPSCQLLGRGWELKLNFQIRSSKTLHALVRTCRSFHNIFTPFLFRFWRLELFNYSPAEMMAMSTSPLSGLRYTRELEISIGEFNSFWYLENPFTKWVGMSYLASIVKLLSGPMISIRSLR
jgi:hypothetical protein